MTPPRPQFCTRCLYSSVSAVPLTFDENGVCSGCRVSAQRHDIDWGRRREMLYDVLTHYAKTRTSDYDCIIPVSGGKDSFFQVHTITEMGFRPLLVTYDANNWTDVGLRNLKRMRESFPCCDHVVFTPSVRVLKALNRLGMLAMGDMNWQAHAGIFTLPIREAVLRKIPLMVWGEMGYANLGGMHSYGDFVEFTYRFRHEHGLRGYEWTDMIRLASKHGEVLNAHDLAAWRYPTDEQIDDVGVRGIYISNYVKWDAKTHGPLMQKLYGFEFATPSLFQRTFETMSNLDDQHENGIHDYMKWIKLGYGRATDHACRAIRAGLMTREEGMEEARCRDFIKSDDLVRWLDYVGWSEAEFDRVADQFRDPRVWWREDGEWKKHNVWDQP